MTKAVRLATALALAALPLGQAQAGTDTPYAGTGQIYPKQELNDAKKSLKYCKKPGYFGKDEDGTTRASCARLAFKTGDLSLARTWLDEGQRVVDAQPLEKRRQTGNLLRLQGDLYHAQGEWLKARDTYRYIYRHMLDLDLLYGNFLYESPFEYASLNGLLEDVTTKLQKQAIEDTRQTHPQVYPVLAGLRAEMEGWWFAGKPKPTDWSDFIARARQVLAADPENAAAYSALTFADIYRNDCAGIIRDGTAAIKYARYGENGELHNPIGNCQSNAGLYEASIKAYDLGIAAKPWISAQRTNRDMSLESIEKRDHPKAFDLYVAAKAGMVEFGTADNNSTILPALDRIDQAINLSPNFPLAYSLRVKLRSRDFEGYSRDRANWTRVLNDDATKAYRLNPESIESIFAIGELYFHPTMPGSSGAQDRAAALRAMLWFKLAKTLAPDDHKSAVLFEVAQRGSTQLSWEEERQRENENAAYVTRRDQEQRDRDAALLAKPREKDPCRDPDYYEAFKGRLCFGDRPN